MAVSMRSLSKLLNLPGDALNCLGAVWSKLRRYFLRQACDLAIRVPSSNVSSRRRPLISEACRLAFITPFTIHFSVSLFYLVLVFLSTLLHVSVSDVQDLSPEPSLTFSCWKRCSLLLGYLFFQGKMYPCHVVNRDVSSPLPLARGLAAFVP
jgi:hypothetical protein